VKGRCEDGPGDKLRCWKTSLWHPWQSRGKLPLQQVPESHASPGPGAWSWIMSSSVLSILAGVTRLLGLPVCMWQMSSPWSKRMQSRNTIWCRSLSKCWQICRSAPMHLDISMRLGLAWSPDENRVSIPLHDIDCGEVNDSQDLYSEYWGATPNPSRT